MFRCMVFSRGGGGGYSWQHYAALNVAALCSSSHSLLRKCIIVLHKPQESIARGSK